MESVVYRDSLSAWQGLCDVGGLEVDGRDEDLATQLKNQIDPDASNLECALAATSTDLFLQALFQVTQPFALMFRDVLDFFERAGEHEGQTQWKVSVGGEFVDLRHFEEFLQHWNSIECEVEVPAIGLSDAFIPNNVRLESGSSDYLIEDKSRDGSITTGIKDVDAWLAEYGKGRYAPFPESLHPDKLGPGLNDAAQIVIAALSVIRTQGHDREEMIAEHRARSYRCDKRDAFHPWTIAQNETDYWLRSTVQYLAILLLRPEEEQKAFGAKLKRAYAKFPRRHISAHIQMEDLERLLSLPAWRKRYELYGVWVATAIMEALKDQEVTINSANGELKFAFGEARIADVETSRPKVSLYSERRTPLASPVGKGRVSSVQPDFGLWTYGPGQDECVMIIEVKHYKRRSRRNFRDALIDYATAHPNAMIVLVNYGPVGGAFTDLPNKISERCKMIGYLSPGCPSAQDSFRKAVQSRVGPPVIKAKGKAWNASVQGITESAEVIVVDTSQSMSQILRSDWFMEFTDGLKDSEKRFAFVDNKIREFGTYDKLKDWISQHNLGLSTSLSGPVSELLKDYERIIVVTDQGGRDSLYDLSGTICELNVDNQPDVRLLQISKPELSKANEDYPGDLKTTSRQREIAGAITKNKRRLSSLDEWFDYAPPKRKEEHWKDGRSAKENARLWLNAAPCLPSEIADILRSCTDVGTLRTWHAEPEARVPIDHFRGEPPNIDILLRCEDEYGPLVVAVEAKADEPFGDTIEKTLCDAKSLLKRNPESKKLQRVKNLAATFGLSLEREEILALRYQLFTLTAAALAEAERRAAQRAIVIIHEFATSLTSSRKRAQNVSDLDNFLQLGFGIQYPLRSGMMVGPVKTKGNGELYFGKAQTIAHV